MTLIKIHLIHCSKQRQHYRNSCLILGLPLCRNRIIKNIWYTVKLSESWKNSIQIWSYCFALLEPRECKTASLIDWCWYSAFPLYWSTQCFIQHASFTPALFMFNFCLKFTHIYWRANWFPVSCPRILWHTAREWTTSLPIGGWPDRRYRVTVTHGGSIVTGLNH